MTVLLCAAISVAAQKTVVQDAGGGRKLELDYNAAGQVTQQRTLSADGKVLERVDLQYHPGFFGADQTNTTYWPDGNIKKITRNTYDASSNFTGEFIQVFDESSKQIAGHRLTHDPMTNVYTCADWNIATQDYKTIQCPASEESAGSPEQAKKFTYEEVVKHLDAARKAAGEKPQSMTPAESRQDFGFVVPAQVYPGERISGSLVTNAAEYEAMPEVSVTRVSLADQSAGEVSTLGDWNVLVRGETPQRADAPIAFTVPRGGLAIDVTFERTGNSPHSVSQPIMFPESSVKPQKMPASFHAPALCLKGQLCVVQGPFGRGSAKTFAAFEDRPAVIAAETPDTAYIRIPDLTQPGQRPLFMAQGSKVIALPVVVAEFTLKNRDRELQQGQNLVTFPILEGPSDIPDAAWRPGNFPATNLDMARALIPGFQLRREYRAQRERRDAQLEPESGESREPAKGGSIVLVVKNMTPEQVSMRGAKDQMIVFHLNDQSFSRGEFKYDLIVEAIKSGHFDIRGYVIPFLAPVPGQEFSTKSPARQQSD